MVSAEVLKIGVQEIQKRWSNTSLPIRAVVAVPVDFGYEERSQIVEAARQAGIVVEQFVSEPTAALVGLDERANQARHIMVFDWGGGTLAVSVLRFSYGRIAELAKGGLRIGGDTLDDLFAHWLHNEHRKSHNVPFFDEIPAKTKDRILTRSELEKRNLSENTEADVVLPEYFGHVLNETLDRTMFENIIADKVEDAILNSIKTLKSAKVSLDELDAVLLVGGSSKIPLVKKKLEQIFGERCEYPEEAEWCIAKGAARLSRRSGSYLLSKSVGVVLSDNTFLPVLRRGEAIDHQPKHITLGLVEEAKDARLIIAESFDDRLTDDNHKQMDVISIPTAGFQLEPIEVEFKIERDLSLSLFAADGFYRSKRYVSRKYTNLEFEYRLEEWDGGSGR
jgi:molecular chaperone DnaK